MPRYFSKITIDELKSKIDFLDNPYLIRKKFEKDLKVEFDFENFDCDDDDLLGYHTLDNGLTFLGCSAGGDWETPVFFIIYFDGKKLRAYVPKKGNTWNKKTKQAYGNEEEEETEMDSEFNSKEILEDIKSRILSK